MAKSGAQRFREWRKRKRKAVIDALGGACEKCGSKRHLHIHHQKPIGHNGNRHYYWNEIGELNLFCERCHVKHHSLKNKEVKV